MQVRFWGVRGSVPWATRSSVGHGCNTPCVEVRDPRTGALLVLDAGSGIVGLGQELGQKPQPIPILLTHYHWDHLQGLPFFAPFFQDGWTSTIYAPTMRHVDPAWVNTIFDEPFFPVPVDRLPSRPSVKLLPGTDAEVGGFRVKAQPLRHPGGALAYRIVNPTGGGDLVYATDHEFGDAATDAALARFAAGAGALILDAHFTPAELTAHAGWGHSSWRQCTAFAGDVGTAQLWLFHHKPGRTDEELTAIEGEARQVFAGSGAAVEGRTFDL